MSFDIDIDLPSSFKAPDFFKDWVPASILQNESLRPHPCGIYPQSIAKDEFTDLACIPYDIADEMGYLKLDFLHLNIYDYFQSREEIEELVEIEPDWDLLLVPSNIKKLYQLSNHIDLVLQLKPRSIEDLADAIALIRPGKIELLPIYLANKAKGRQLLYSKNSQGFAFKKSHSLAYSLVIVLQLHLIDAGIC
jgi:hypothetical protein